MKPWMASLKQCLGIAALTCGIALTSLSSAIAQSSEGTDFWLTFTPNLGEADDESLSLAIASRAGATVTVTATPGKGSTASPMETTLTLAPNESRIVSFPAAMMLEKDGKYLVDRNSVHVSSDNPVSIHGRNLIKYSTDGYLALPTTALGTEYLLVSYTSLVVGSFTPHVKVVATEDDTEVTFHSKGKAKAGDGSAIPAGGSRSVSLKKGETTIFHGDGGIGVEIAGSRIVASKPVAVIAGNTCTYVPDSEQACDHLDEMLPPVTALGQSYILAPTKRRLPGDLVRIVASLDGTVVYRSGLVVRTLSKGQWYEYLLDAPEELKLSRPALVAQFLRGTNAAGYPGDPAEMLVVPTAQFLSSYQVATFQEPPIPPETEESIRLKDNYLSAVIPTGALSTLRLDDAPVDVTLFNPVPGTNFSSGTLPVALGSHRLEAAVPFGLYAYGLGEYESYAVPGGMAIRNINDTSDPFPPNARLVTVGDEIRGLATDSSDSNANGLLDPDEAMWGAGIGPRSEDVNMNNVLDAGEDRNGNGRIDRDLGLKFIELAIGSSNLQLETAPYSEGDGAAAFTLRRIDPAKDGLGTLLVADRSGNTASFAVGLVSSTTIHNVRVREVLSRENIDLDLTSFATVPASLEEYDDRYEFEWFFPVASTLSDIDLGYDVVFKKPVAGETRVVNRRLTLDYDDAAGNPVHYEIGPQSVQVLPTALDIAASLDKSRYLTGENGTLSLALTNLGLVRFNDTRLCVQLRDRAGIALGASKQLFTGTLEPGAGKTLSSELPLSQYMIGEYEVKIDLTAYGCGLGTPIKSLILPFEIVDQPGLVAIDSGLKLDRAFYQATDRVSAASVVRNLHPQSLADGYGLRLQIVRPDGTSLAPALRAVPNLVPRNEWNTVFDFQLVNEPPGQYEAVQQLLDVHGNVVQTRSARFVVRASAETGFGLSGTLSVDPQTVPLGGPLRIDYGVVNQGNSGYSALPARLRIVDPAAGSVVAEWPLSLDLAAGGTTAGNHSWVAQGMAGDQLIAVLAVEIGSKEVALAQQSFTLAAAQTVLTGSLAAAPKAPVLGQPVSLGYEVRNDGVAGLAGLEVHVRILDGGAVVADLPLTLDLAAGGAQSGSVAWTAQGAAGATLTAVLVAVPAGGEIELARDTVTLAAPDPGQGLSGTLSANPVHVEIGEAVSLAYGVHNSGLGDLSALALVLRLVEADSGAQRAELPLSLDLAAGATQAGNLAWTAQGAAGDVLLAKLLALIGGKEVPLAEAELILMAPALKLGLTQEQERATRMLVFAACAGHGEGNEQERAGIGTSSPVVAKPGQTRFASCDTAGDGHDETADELLAPGQTCGLGRAQAIDELLNGLGIAHRITVDPTVFAREFRSGAYTTYWVSGLAYKLNDEWTPDIREAVFRGESFLMDGVHDRREWVLDDTAGITQTGFLAANQAVWIEAPMVAGQQLASAGRGLQFSLVRGQPVGTFGGPNGTVAISASQYGQGRSLFVGLDLVASLLADGRWPAQLTTGLDWLLPVLPPAATAGAYTAVVLQARNDGPAAEVEVRSTLPAGAAFVAADPVPNSQTGPIAWRLSLAAGETRSLRLSFRAPLAAGSYVLESEIGGIGAGGYTANGTPQSLPLLVESACDRLPALQAQVQALLAVETDYWRRWSLQIAVTAIGEAAAAIAIEDWENATLLLDQAGGSLLDLTTAEPIRQALGLAVKEVYWRWTLVQP